MALPREQISSLPISRGQAMSSVGSLKLRGNIDLGWQVTPSIGIVAKDMDRLGLDIRSYRKPMTDAVKRIIIPSIRKNFDQGGRPPWEPLSPDTIKLRGDAWPILQRTGKLRKGATQFNIWDIGETSATVRRLPANVWYGALHQQGHGGFGKHVRSAKKALGRGASSAAITRKAFEIMDAARGGKAASVEIPQRRFIMYQEQDVDDIQELFLEWLLERAQRVGRFS